MLLLHIYSVRPSIGFIGDLQVLTIIDRESSSIYNIFKSITKETHLLGGPLEASNDRVLDLVEVLHSLGAVDQDVGPHGVGTKAPDLPRFGNIVLVLVCQVAATDLEVVTGIDLSLKEKWEDIL